MGVLRASQGHSQDLRLCGSQNGSFSITWTQARNNKLSGTPRLPALDLLEVGPRLVHWDSSPLGTGMQAPVEEPRPVGEGGGELTCQGLRATPTTLHITQWVGAGPGSTFVFLCRACQLPQGQFPFLKAAYSQAHHLP